MLIDFNSFEARCRQLVSSMEDLRRDGTTIVVDGVIVPERYFNAKPRLMWLLKEANSDRDWSYQDAFTNEQWLSENNGLATIRRVIYTSYGILHGIEKEWKDYPWSYQKECLESLRDIAIVNIKKRPGESTAVHNEIKDAYIANRQLLRNQFDIYDPDIVIFGNTKTFINIEDFPGLTEAEKQVSPFNNHYYYTHDKLYINAWHPACRGRDFTDYNYVMDIVGICREWMENKNC